MTKYIPYPLNGIFAATILFLHTMLCGSLILSFSLFKIILKPFGLGRKSFYIIRAPFHFWYRATYHLFRFLLPVRIEVELPSETLDPTATSLLIANHQSYVDIPLILSCLKDHIASPTFFAKKDLIWVPFIGSSIWAMDMIFVSRPSKKQLLEKPELKGRDIETAREKCKKLEHYSTTLLNFCEGTRFTTKKYNKTSKYFKHLLPPKAGGVNFTLNAMGNKITDILDVSIVYHNRESSFIAWEFLCGKIQKIDVKVRKIPLSEEMFGDYTHDEQYRKYFQSELNNIWLEKDKYIESIKKPSYPNKTEPQPHR